MPEPSSVCSDSMLSTISRGLVTKVPKCVIQPHTVTHVTLPNPSEDELTSGESNWYEAVVH